jgi:hypothetical protein
LAHRTGCGWRLTWEARCLLPAMPAYGPTFQELDSLSPAMLDLSMLSCIECDAYVSEPSLRKRGKSKNNTMKTLGRHYPGGEGTVR